MTINKRNKYGFKTGIWKYFNGSSGKLENQINYSGEIFWFDIELSGESYYLNGTIQKKWNQDSVLNYNESGNVINCNKRQYIRSGRDRFKFNIVFSFFDKFFKYLV